MRAHPTVKDWERRKEILAVLPPETKPLSGEPPPEPWASLLRGLSQEWRVFVARAPLKGERLAIGRAGLDSASLDTLPAIRKILAEQLISAVILIGESSVLDCLEPLHSFAPHLPFIAALGEPQNPRWRQESARLEFLLGWCDGLLLADASCRAKLAPAIRRLPMPVKVLPRPRSLEWPRVLEDFSRFVQSRFLDLAGRAPAKRSDWVAYLSADCRPRWEAAIEEWRSCLPDGAGAFLVPASENGTLRRRLRKSFPRSLVLAYRDEEEAVVRANQALGRGRSPQALLLSPTARISPVSLDRMIAAAANHPLAGAVCASASAPDPRHDFRMWTAFASAWLMKNRGAYRLTHRLSDRCVLLNREALVQSGFLDPRLGWSFALHDLALRLRQNGWALFQADDAVVAFEALAYQNGEARRQAFLRKWAVDPADLLNGTQTG